MRTLASYTWTSMPAKCDTEMSSFSYNMCGGPYTKKLMSHVNITLIYIVFVNIKTNFFSYYLEFMAFISLVPIASICRKGAKTIHPSRKDVLYTRA